MTDDQLYDEIYEMYQNEDDESVIRLWELHGNKKLDLTNIKHRNVNDALASSYLETKNYDKSLQFVNNGIAFIKKHNELIDNDFNMEFYYNMKSHIFRSIEKCWKEYLTYKEYKEIGGENNVLLKSMEALESFLFEKYVIPSAYFFCFLYVIIILLNHVFHIYSYSSYIYNIFLLFGLIVIVWFYFFKDSFKRFFFSLI